MDATLLAASAAEVRSRAVGARVERVTQPEPHLILLHLWGGADPEARLLLVCVQPPLARVHLTWRRRENPPQPPAFCQGLRRHLEGARLSAAEQPGLERLLYLRFAARDDLGNPAARTLAVELLGQRSDVLLLGPDGRVLDALRRRDAVGRPYGPPPSQSGKLDPSGAAREAIAAALTRGGPAEVLLGISPRLGRELELAAGPDPARLADLVAATVDAARRGQLTPPLARAWKLPTDTGGDVGRACDAAYGTAEEAAALATERQRLRDVLRVQQQRVERRIGKQEEELREAEAAGELRLQGELLLAHLGRVPRGAAEVLLPAFDDPGRPVRVPLDPRLAPAANAQAIFRRYRKAQRAGEHLESQLAAARAEQAYLADAARAADQAESLPEARAVADELAAEGYLARPASRREKGKATQVRAEPVRVAARGWTILVGRNARQNDWLTMRAAQPDDWWLHAKELPGSHVLLRADSPAGPQAVPPPEVLRRAAALAAYYSTARHGSHVVVDYTQRRHVWKPRGARPGFVLYDHERSISVDPEAP